MTIPDPIPDFKSDADAVRWWRGLAKDLSDDLDSAREALDDIGDTGRELEAELERDLAETERREKELRASLEKLKSEHDDGKTRYQSALRDHAATLAHMQEALDKARKSEEAYRLRVRDMELDNDDLEKSERAMSTTLSDLEARYGSALERATMLEQELVSKAMLEEELQRLKDELRDLTEELSVLKMKQAAAPPPISRPVTPPGAGVELPLTSPSPVRSSVEEKTPRKLADLRQSSIARVTPPSPGSKIPSPVVNRTAPKSTAATRKTDRDLVSDFRQRKERIMAARTERQQTERVAFGSSIPRPASSLRTRRTTMQLSYGPTADESPTVSAAQRRTMPPPASMGRRPPSRMSTTGSSSSSRPTTPSPALINGRSPTPSSLNRVAASSTPNRRKSGIAVRPTSALGHRSSIAPPLPSPGLALGSRAPISATHNRRQSLTVRAVSTASPIPRPGSTRKPTQPQADEDEYF